VSLAPGRWYVGVYNTTNATANYNIVASWSAAPLWKYVELTNAMPVPFTVSSFGIQTNFYRFVVDGTNAGVLFEIYGDTNRPMNGNVDLLVKRADLPARDLYDFSFLQRDLDLATFSYLPELVALRTNIFIPDLNATNWFLQIANANPNFGAVDGWICAKVIAAGTNALYDCEDMMLVTAFPIPGGPFTLTWNSVPGEKYAVEETANLKTWATAKVVKATKTKTSFTAPAPKAGPPRFYRVKQVPP
jgi:hypothetical protein